MAKGVGLLSESIRIFQKLGNMQNLRKAEYYLAVSKANQIFDDVCTTIRGAFTNDVCQKPFLSKWKAWFFRKNVSWVAKSGAEEIKDKAIILNEKYYTDGFLEAAFNNPDTGRRPDRFSPNQSDFSVSFRSLPASPNINDFDNVTLFNRNVRGLRTKL